MSRRVILVVSLAVLSCFGLTQAHGDHDRAYNVSLIRLIANPKIFDAHRLRAVGYLDYNGIDRSLGIYVTEIDARNVVMSNSVDLRIETPAAKLIGKYVVLEGTYHAPTGPLADYSNGYLDNVSELKPLERGDLPK